MIGRDKTARSIIPTAGINLEKRGFLHIRRYLFRLVVAALMSGQADHLSAWTFVEGKGNSRRFFHHEIRLRGRNQRGFFLIWHFQAQKTVFERYVKEHVA